MTILVIFTGGMATAFLVTVSHIKQRGRSMCMCPLWQNILFMGDRILDRQELESISSNFKLVVICILSLLIAMIFANFLT